MRAGEDPPPIVCTNVKVTTVRPLEKTDHVKTIDPTPMDMLIIDIFVPVFFAYRLEDNADVVYKQLVNRMKKGLRKVLVPFFPWAGRWIAVPPRSRRRQLECDDKGVHFIEAYVDQNLDSVVRVSADFKPVVELQGYTVLGMNPRQLRQQMRPDGLPCTFIQVTRFKCGGVVVAVTSNHMLADGKSFFDFMTAWSDFSRTGKTNIICDHNRAAGPLLTTAGAPQTPVYVPPPQWDLKCYEVSASVIASLKTEVQTRGEPGAYVSTMDCIFAHMWKTLSSLSFEVIGGKEIGMVNSVEGRTRFSDPPVPNLLGNLVVSMRSPSISTAELLEMPLSVIARRIREKMLPASKEWWLSPEREAEAVDAFTNNEVLPWGQTCWNSFSLYKIDFGFGNPFFSPGLNNSNFSWYLMFGLTYVGPPTPGVSSSAAFMVIRSIPQVLKALEDHPDFLSFFLPDKNE